MALNRSNFLGNQRATRIKGNRLTMPQDQEIIRKDSQQRLFSIDALRAVAIVGVVVIHGLDQILRFSANQSSPTWWYANVFNSSVRWVLPAFFMISGMLLLSKDEDLHTFLTKRLKRIIVPTLFWSAMYGIWTWSQYNPHLTIKDHLIATFVYGTPYYHLYFLFAIFGFYLLNPVFTVFVSHASQRRLAYAVIIFLVMASIANISVGWFLHAYPGSRLISLFQWVPFVGYYLAGLYLNRYPLTWTTKKILFTISSFIVLASVATFWLTSTFGHGPRGVLLQDYLSPNVIVVTLLVFTLFARIKEKNLSTWANVIVRELAAASFGIYLIHLIVMETLGRIITPLLGAQPGAIANLVLIFCTLVMSYVFVKLGSFITLIKKTLGY